MRQGTGAQAVRLARALAHRLRSLTMKNLAIFLAIFSVALAPLAFAYWQDVRAQRISASATRLELIAEQSGRRLDPGLVERVADRDATGSADQLRLVAILGRIQQEFDVDNAVLMRRQADGAFQYIADGNGQFYVTQPVFVHEQFPESLRAAVHAWERQGVPHSELFGFGEFDYLQFNRPIEQNGRVIALLLLNEFAEDVDQAIRHETMKLVTLTVVIFLTGALVFWAFSTRLLRPLARLKEAANRLAAGELDVAVSPVRGGDEVALLNESFRSMVHQLKQSREALESNNEELKRTLARVQLMEDLEKSLFKLVPRTVRSALDSDPRALERGKTEKDVTVLFLDVEGSTTLSDSLEPRAVEHLIEGYFSQFLDIVYEHQGDVTETAGDGLMIIFQSDDPAQHAWNAVSAALEVQSATKRLRSQHQALASRLRINIGINSGSALVGFTRYEAISGTRVTFTASGRTTIVAARLQDLARGGSVLVGEETLGRVRRHEQTEPLGMELEDLGAVSLKNIHAPQRVYRICEAPHPQAPPHTATAS